MAQKRILTIDDWNSITSSMGSLSSRTTACENAINTNTSGVSSLVSRMNAAESGISSLSTRMGAAEGKVSALETWRAAKAPASPDVSTNWTIPTAIITLGLNAPTAAGLKTIVDTIMGEVNGLKAILRSREIMAT